MMKKFLPILMIIVLMTILLVGCTGNEGASSVPESTPESGESDETDESGGGEPEAPEDKDIVNLAILKGPTGIGAANLLEKNAGGVAVNEYNVTVAGAPDEINAKLISGELDIAAVPTNVASLLYNRTDGEIQILAVNTLGVLHIVSSDPTIESVGDLEGRTIVSAGQGAIPEYAIDFILKQNGVEADIEYKAEHSEVASLFLAGEADVVLVPEPFVTQILNQSEEAWAVLDLTEEWNKVAEDSILTMGCVVVRREFAENHKEAVDQFLTEYAESIDQANNDVGTTAQICERYDIIAAAVAEKAIPNCNIVYVDGSGMARQVGGFLEVLHEANPESVGGTLPSDDFYYVK